MTAICILIKICVYKIEKLKDDDKCHERITLFFKNVLSGSESFYCILHIYVCSTHRDRVTEPCLPYGTLPPHVHMSGTELCSTCSCGVVWAVDS